MKIYYKHINTCYMFRPLTCGYAQGGALRRINTYNGYRVIPGGKAAGAWR